MAGGGAQAFLQGSFGGAATARVRVSGESRARIRTEARRYLIGRFLV